MRRFWLALLFVGSTLVPLQAAELPPGARCPVCGMKAAIDPSFTAVLTVAGKPIGFDGPRDMLTYLFDPATFGGDRQAGLGTITLLDYYDETPFDGRTAYFVVGSDVAGPMGPEFIPFNAQDAAEEFRHDHGGTVVPFAQVTPGLVRSIATGHGMPGMEHGHHDH